MNDQKQLVTISLENRFKNAWQFLTENHATQALQKKPKTLNKLPWYLLIGANGAGKTSFIKHATLKFIPANHLNTQPADENTTEKHINFWFSHEATFIDPPGNYFNPTDASPTPEFLPILKKYIQRKPLAGVITVINLAEWTLKTKTAQQAFIEQLKQTLHALTVKQKTTCPLYLIFTHIDCIYGFQEFFAELGHEEREQPWGITLNHLPTNNLTNTFKINYDRLLKRLHERIIWRLQHERSIEKRTKIQRFPVQMEFLKESFTQCCYQLADICTPHGMFSYEGIYFVSNLQNSMLLDDLCQISPTTVTTTQQPATEIQIPTKNLTTTAYFSQRLFKKIIFGHPCALKTQSIVTATSHLYWIAAGIVLLSLIFLAYSLHIKTNTINQAQLAFAEYRESAQSVALTDHNLEHNLIPLKHLVTAAKQLQQAHLPWLMIQGLQHPKLQTLIENTYQSELNMRFLPSLGAKLEQIALNNSDPNVSYGALKVYLMLGIPEHYNPIFIQNWLNNYWKTSLKNNPALQQQLNTHLTALLTKPIVPLTLNQTSITQARNNLNNIHPSKLAYAILNNQTVQTLLNPLLTDKDSDHYKKIFAHLEQADGIPNLYTANQFKTIYFQTIKQACELTIQGDWIIGKKNAASNDTDISTTLIQSVQIDYLKNYVNYWQGFLQTLQITPAQTGQQLLNTLDNLLSETTLTHLFQIINNHTTLDQLLPEKQNIADSDIRNIQTYLITPFEPLHEMLENKIKKQLVDALKNLKHFVANITNARNSEQTAFEFAKYKFTHINKNEDAIDGLITQSQDMPLPIQNWLNTLANNSWHYVLQETKNYLTLIWQKEVLPEYNKSINNYYPVFKNAKNDISLANFTQFFGPVGTIHHYFVTYLAPFVDINAPTWQWRTSHNGKLDISNDFLVQLERAAIIKTMFFNTQQQLLVNFTLRLQTLSPEIQQFAFNLNGQNFADKKWNKVKHSLSWPMLDKPQQANITLIDKNNQKQILAFVGPWALFKILDKSTLNADEENDKRFTITFNLNGLSAHYELIAGEVVNPFMPDIINTFRCPTKM